MFVSGTTSNPKEPRSYREAVDPNNPNSPEWIAAINAELDSLQEHGTWEYVPRPKDKPIVSCKWVWHVKVKSNGSVERFKARLVARGFTQTHGVDYNETFAPVTRLDTLRLLTAMAVQRDWEFRHLNVKTAYLHGDLEEEVYMAVPQGLEDVPEDYVLKLKKALYGLKQAGCHHYDFLVRLWNGLNFFQTFIISFSLGIDHDPYVLYDHMTYVYSFSYISFFTRSHGQEKSLSYYDLFNFGVLFYGRIPTLIFFYFLHKPTTPILPVYVDQRWPHLEKDTTRP